MPCSIGVPLWHWVWWKKGSGSWLQKWPALKSRCRCVDSHAGQRWSLDPDPFFHQTQCQSEIQKEQGIGWLILNTCSLYWRVFWHQQQLEYKKENIFEIYPSPFIELDSFNIFFYIGSCCLIFTFCWINQIVTRNSWTPCFPCHSLCFQLMARK